MEYVWQESKSNNVETYVTVKKLHDNTFIGVVRLDEDNSYHYELLSADNTSMISLKIGSKQTLCDAQSKIEEHLNFYLSKWSLR